MGHRCFPARLAHGSSARAQGGDDGRPMRGVGWRQQGERLTRDREAPYPHLLFLADARGVAGRDDGHARDRGQRVRGVIGRAGLRQPRPDAGAAPQFRVLDPIKVHLRRRNRGETVHPEHHERRALRVDDRPAVEQRAQLQLHDAAQVEFQAGFAGFEHDQGSNGPSARYAPARIRSTVQPPSIAKYGAGYQTKDRSPRKIRKIVTLAVR